jgi:hypothetical protein
MRGQQIYPCSISDFRRVSLLLLQPENRTKFTSVTTRTVRSSFKILPSAKVTQVAVMTWLEHVLLCISGTLLLASAQNDNTDQLWLLSGDCFPFQNILMEGQSLLPIDGRIWALEEMPYRGHLTKLYRDSFGSNEPPLVTVQHAQPARKFVLISAQVKK